MASRDAIHCCKIGDWRLWQEKKVWAKRSAVNQMIYLFKLGNYYSIICALSPRFSHFPCLKARENTAIRTNHTWNFLLSSLINIRSHSLILRVLNNNQQKFKTKLYLPSINSVQIEILQRGEWKGQENKTDKPTNERWTNRRTNENM